MHALGTEQGTDRRHWVEWAVTGVLLGKPPLEVKPWGVMAQMARASLGPGRCGSDLTRVKVKTGVWVSGQLPWGRVSCWERTPPDAHPDPGRSPGRHRAFSSRAPGAIVWHGSVAAGRRGRISGWCPVSPVLGSPGPGLASRLSPTASGGWAATSSSPPCRRARSSSLATSQSASSRPSSCSSSSSRGRPRR